MSSSSSIVVDNVDVVDEISTFDTDLLLIGLPLNEVVCDEVCRGDDDDDQLGVEEEEQEDGDPDGD